MNSTNELKALTLFSGGGGADLGIHAAGITDVKGIEYIDDIAANARRNGLDVDTADILDVDPADYAPVDLLHASPPCPSFSTAKADREETANDIALSAKVAEFIDVLRPAVFTLENVYGYRLSKSWQIIADKLDELGYSFNYWHLCAADYGVPQTRRRMIVIALANGAAVSPPYTTHSKDGSGATLFEPAKPRWGSWYQAIDDLVPTLPDSEFAPWQFERLPEKYKSVLINPNRPSSAWKQGPDAIESGNPAPTVSRRRAGDIRAFLVEPFGADDISAESSAPTVLASEKTAPPRAFIVSDEFTGNGKAIIRDGDQSMITVKTQSGGHPPRAFIAHPTDMRSMPTRNGGEPVWTITASNSAGNGNHARAFIANGTPNSNGESMTVKGDGEPMFTVTAETGTRRQIRAAAGRVVKMTPRALARFQSFPDSYILPEKPALACRIIGNAVPPLMMTAIVEHALKIGGLTNE